MTDPRSSRAAGGPIALLILGGAGVGLVMGEPTIGFLVGLALGVALAVGMWVRDRR